MKEEETGGAAFPIFPETGAGHAAAHQGMTLRDYFAAKAMQSHVGAQWAQHYATKPNEDVNNHWDDNDIAMCAYDIADAMLEARK